MSTRSTRKDVPLDSVLESLPLVYDTTTKKLCIFTRKVQYESPNGGLFKSQENAELCNTSCSDLLYCQSDYSKQLDESSHFIPSEHSCKKDELMCEASKRKGKTTFLLYESEEDISQQPSSNLPDSDSVYSFSSLNTELSRCSFSDGALCSSDKRSSLDNISFTNDERKKKGFSSLLSRTIFPWRHKDVPSTSPSFIAATDSQVASPTSSLLDISKDYEASFSAWKLFSWSNASLIRSSGKKARNSDVEAGSVGLIMEGRPSTLPAKTELEEQKHKQEYELMVSAAKRREQQGAREKKKAREAQIRQEEMLIASVETWNNEIIPKWDKMKTHRKCRELWWLGLPSCIRGRVWKLAIGNELSLTEDLYTILVERSLKKSTNSTGHLNINIEEKTDFDSQVATLDLIHLDVSRTFPHLCFFQKGGPYHDPLHNILGAYVCYRPDIGYVQGMSFLAATFLLNMSETDAFICFSNLLNHPLHMAFFKVNQPLMNAYYSTFEELLKENLPKLNDHLLRLDVTSDLYVLEWIVTIFSRPLPLDVAAHVWDLYFRDGEEFLFKAAISILKLYEDTLLEQDCTTTTAQFLTRLPDDLSAEALFKSISSVSMVINKKRTFEHILCENIELVSEDINATL